MISTENRAEFDDLGVEQLRKRVEASTYDPDKLREAREYLREHDPAWTSVQLAKAAGTRATIALIISAIAAAIAIATFFDWPNFRSAQEQQMYDGCLMSMRGNKTACDAFMRQLQRAKP
jgi:hypothetical protein